MPEYEVSAVTVDCLYRQARENGRKESAARLLMEDVQQATEEYRSESKH